MAAVTTTLQRQAANSVCYSLSGFSGTGDSIANAQLVGPWVAPVATLRDSRMKAFLSAEYDSASDVNVAWAQTGGDLTGASLVSYAWDVDGSGLPILNVQGVAGTPATLRLSLSYSASE